MLKQINRQIRLNTPLEQDRLVFKSMVMTEELGRLYEAELELYSDDGQIPYNDVLGHMVTVELDRAHAAPRFFTGYVRQFGFAGSHGRRYIYRATVVPWFWVLTRTQDCRIFHDKTVDEIIRSVFEQYKGLSDFEFRLTRKYQQYEYTVQYRECDFSFVSRLMEKEGIYYFFEHTEGGHRLIITDAVSEHEPAGGYETLEYFARDDYSVRRRECVFGWHPAERVQPGRVTLQDFDFKKPGVDLTREAALRREHGVAEMEVYDYPGVYFDHGPGQHYARTRIEELHSTQATVSAQGNTRGVETGRVFGLIMHPVGEQNTDYLVTGARYELTADDYESGGEEAEIYRCQFSALKKTEVFRPARTTRKPLVPGPQTATVVGEDEIDCDEFGRILVRFHWDRLNDISMRCRVSQNWAGNGWGGMVIPRVGMEVVVEFLEGDPDRPLVTGCVYNGRNAVPYGLPEHKTMSTFKTDTHNGNGYNELRFEDKKDEEEIFLHAEKDHNTIIENDETHTIHRDRRKTIDRDQFESVGRDKTTTVDRDHNETIKRDSIVTVQQDDKQFVLRNAERQVDKDSFDYVNNHRVEFTYANHEEEVGGHYKHKVGGSHDTEAGQKIFTRTKLHVLEAENKVLIGGPGGTIEINSAGVVIRANKIDLKAASINQSGGGPDQVSTIESTVNEGLELAEVCALRKDD